MVLFVVAPKSNAQLVRSQYKDWHARHILVIAEPVGQKGLYSAFRRSWAVIPASRAPIPENPQKCP